MAESGSLKENLGSLLTSESQYDSVDAQSQATGQDSNTTSSSFTSIYLTKGTNAETHAYWTFDLSAIPESAEIDSVVCKVKAAISQTSSSRVATKTAQLYSGTTAKGSTTSITSSVGTVYTLSVGTWTRNELTNCRLHLYAKRGSSNRNDTTYFLVYGADVTVQYTVNNEKFMLKLGGAWHDVARVFKKVNGVWVEQEELANVIENGVRYKNGGEIISPKKTVTITGSGDATYCYVTINGVKYTSATTIEVSSGDVIEATVGGTNVDSLGSGSCCVKVDGTVYVDKGGTHNHTVTSDCTVDLYLYSGYGKYGTITITT